jgi:hypothetical protein
MILQVPSLAPFLVAAPPRDLSLLDLTPPIREERKSPPPTDPSYGNLQRRHPIERHNLIQACSRNHPLLKRRLPNTNSNNNNNNNKGKGFGIGDPFELQSLSLLR